MVVSLLMQESGTGSEAVPLVHLGAVYSGSGYRFTLRDVYYSPDWDTLVPEARGVPAFGPVGHVRHIA